MFRYLLNLRKKIADMKESEGNERITVIKKKLDLLRLIDRNFSVFGSEFHRYNFNPCLTEEQIQEFEQTEGIRLPKEYRSFLMHIGNGGAGPYYGILPLSEYNFHYNEHIYEDIDKSFLAYEFPFKEKWKPIRSQSDEEIATEDKHGAYGTLCVCHEGCGYCFLLVVTGEEKGNIWFDAMVSNQGMAPLTNENTIRFDFITWFENWLNESLKKFD